MSILDGHLVKKLKYLSVVLSMQYEENWNLQFEIKAIQKCSNYF